jgi:hypothetical protein
VTASTFATPQPPHPSSGTARPVCALLAAS